MKMIKKIYKLSIRLQRGTTFLMLSILFVLIGLQHASANTTSQAFSASAEVSLSPQLSCENRDDDIQDVIEQMADFGYGVTTGHFRFWEYDISSCIGCSVGKPFLENFEIPFAERNSHYMVLVEGDDLPSINFAAQDAIVFRGCTPPELTNIRFSFNSFIERRIIGLDSATQEYQFSELIRASLTDPLWVKDLSVEPNDNSLFPAPYDRKMNIVFSADQATVNDLATAFKNADLIDEFNVGFNVQKIPSDAVHFETIEVTDLTASVRLGVMMKWTRLEDYHPNALKLAPVDYIPQVYTDQSFPVYIFYKDDLVAREKISENLLKTKPPSEQKKLTKTYKKPFKALVKEVRAHYQNQGLFLVSDIPFSTQGANVEGQTVFNAEHGDYCVTNEVDCQYDSYADAYWWDQQSHQLDDDDVYVVVGVDHAKLGMADKGSYLGVYDLQDEKGWLAQEIVSWTPSELSWSQASDALVLMDPTLQSVAEVSFLVQLTRSHDCWEDQPEYAFRCVDDTQIAVNDDFIFRGRTSFNPATGTRPSNSQLIPWRLLHFKR